MENSGVSVKVTKDSFLGVTGWRETDQGTEYCCLIWLREVQEYDDEIARIRHRRSLRKRKQEYGSDDDVGERMLKKIRGWGGEMFVELS